MRTLAPAYPQQTILTHGINPAAAGFCLWLLLLLASSGWAQPIISQVSPRQDTAGAQVLISGSGFQSTAGNNIVYFGAARATVVSASAASLTVKVPVGASYAPVSVTVNGLTGYSAEPFVLTFPGGRDFHQNPDLTQNDFEPFVDTPTDLHPNVMAMADFDGDGRVDIATANNYSTTDEPASFSILRNTGEPGKLAFAAHQDFPNGVLTYAIAAGDLDGDGLPDIAVTSVADRTLTIYRNTSSPGSITFASGISYGTGGDPFSIGMADFDGDGRPDLVLCNYFSGTITLYHNQSTTGNLSFSAGSDLAVPITPRSLVTGDLDGDGKPDIAVVCELSNTLSVFRNTSTAGNLLFAGRMDIPTANSGFGLAIGDMDGDDKSDLVVTNSIANSYSIFRNTGSGGNIAFAPRVDFACGGFPYNVSLADMNGDGRVDVVVPSANISVSQNLSTPGNLSFSGPLYLFPRFSLFYAVLVDMDGDGKNDIAASGFSTDRVCIFRNKNNEPGIRDFSPKDAVAGDSISISGYSLSSVTSVSFGGIPAQWFSIVDDNTIRAVVGAGASGNVAVSNQYGTQKLAGFVFHAAPTVSSFTPGFGGTGDTLHITGTYFTDATAVDVGGTPVQWFVINSFNSITAVLGSGSSGSVRVTSPYGSGSLPGYVYYPPPSITSFTPASGGTATPITISGTNFIGATQVWIGTVPAASFQVNSSTSITAVVAEGGAGKLLVVTPGGRAVSDSVFHYPPPTFGGINTMVAAVDSIIIISGTNFQSNTQANKVFFGAVQAQVLLASTTQLTVRVPPGASFDFISVSVNNYTVYSPRRFVVTYPPSGLELSDTSFSWNSAYASNEDPRNLHSADLDGDGLADLVVGDYFGGAISILRNTSRQNRISFAPSFDLVNGLGTNVSLTIALGDINSDGKPDIIVSNWYTVVSVYRNTSVPGQISFAPRVNFPAQYFSRGIVIADFDGDGKPELAMTNFDYPVDHPVMSVYRNRSWDSTIVFDSSVDIPLYTAPFHVRTADFDGDGRMDIAVNETSSRVEVLRNTSTPGHLSFEAPLMFNSNLLTERLAVADFDSDGKPDLATSGTGSFAVLRNISSPGNISFAAAQQIPIPDQGLDIETGQLDADGKTDVMIVSGSKRVLLLRNTGTPGNVSFGNPIAIPTQLTYNWMYTGTIGDLDGDGKPDLAIANGADNKLSIIRNGLGEHTEEYCEGTNIELAAGGSGSIYQWQCNSGDGFANIANGGNYGGVQTPNLSLGNLPADFQDNQYRCLVDGQPGRITNLKVKARVTPQSSISSPDSVCVNSSIAAHFTPLNDIPLNSSVQLWTSLNGAPFEAGASQSYPGYAMDFPAPSAVTGTYRFYFLVAPPANIACAVAAGSDTSSTAVMQLTTPVLSANGMTIQVDNPQAGILYTWQLQGSGGAWNDLLPAVTGNSYQAGASGTYRVRATRWGCTAFSAGKEVNITAIDPVPAAARGIRAFPNPVTQFLYLYGLRLSDRWQTMEIIGMDGKKMVWPLSVAGQTQVKWNLQFLPPGVYTVLLHRASGGPAYIRFIKQ